MKSQESCRPEHFYVILDQQPPADELVSSQQGRPLEDEHDATCEVEVHANQSSNFSLDSKPERGLFTRNKLSDATKKLSSALIYGICSFMITVINKIVLTSYGFPSFNILGLGQVIAILLILKTASLFRVVIIRGQSMRNRKLWTLATFYLGNLITGLGGTKHLPLPMFIALRRFSIAMTAIGEFYVLNVRQSFSIICTIIAMIAGSFIAAAADLTFNALGYVLVMTSNFFTAANGVYTKKTIDSREINKHEILFYNALFTLIPMIVICVCTTNLESLRNFEHWTRPDFILAFLTSCFMGYLLMFSTVLCTHYNSALTTTIVGTLKNIITTYVGMYIGGDYKFNLLNFLGLNVSLIGSLVYSYLSFSSKSLSPAKPKDLPTKC